VEESFDYPSTEALLASDLYTKRSEDIRGDLISLDEAGAPVGGKSMRYDFPGRSNEPNVCHAFTVGRNIKFPEPVTEVWVDVWLKFSPNFSTKVPGCQGQSNPDYKLLFGRVEGKERFGLQVGTFGHSTTWGYPTRTAAYVGRPETGAYFDGRWHRWRLHMRVSPRLLSDGVAVAYFDNTRIASFTEMMIPRRAITGLALGRNMNQGPASPQQLWWGKISVYRTDPGWGW
jgi:hypothetical protein